MAFTWDPAKNAANIAKHGVSFEYAVRIFEGPVLTGVDTRNDYGEMRETSIGLVYGIATLVVVHTDRGGVTRIISARRALKHERYRYAKTI
ncbi:MAG: BrnT family toxin [Alphaproteobacteria bacterium]